MDLEKIYLRYKEKNDPISAFELMLSEYENVLKNETTDNLSEMIKNVQYLKNAVDSMVKNKSIKKRVEELSKIVQPAQRTQGWYNLRNGMFTASSDIGNITGSSYEYKMASNKRDLQHIEDLLILKKCGHDLKGFKGNFATRWGNMFEEVVTQLYSKKVSKEVLEFGLMQHSKYSFIGASPDGITKDGIMVEIKCPVSRSITGEVPSYYWTQIQTQLECCDLDECDFVEAKFKRFNTEASCINDKYSEISGILGEYYKCKCNADDCKCHYDQDNRFYCYPPIGTMNLQKEYINNYQTSNKFLGFVYWGLQQYSCVKVNRDKKWFNEQLPKIEKTWKKVLYYRENSLELENLLKRAISYENEKNNNKLDMANIMSSSDDESN